jgi:hypothetical protein
MALLEVRRRDTDHRDRVHDRQTRLLTNQA